ncbi:MAG: GC-type dockerin domain-anchored protein, partial [Planctomycetota bacterium]
VGPDYLPSNKGGSSRMEGTTRNTRLGIGHTGAERGGRWLTSSPQSLELLAIVGDVKGGSTPARPTLANVLDGTAEGYTVIGPASIVTLGDPRANAAAAGGWGWDASETGSYVNTTPMANEAAAAFVNNITRSITAIQNLDPNAIFTPGEFLAVNFILPAAANNIPATAPTPGNGFVDIIPNPDFNQTVQNFVVNQASNILSEPEFASFDTNTQGVVPERTGSVQYSDGNVLPSVAYVAQNGTTIYNAGDALPAKSTGLSFIAGDFNNDFTRDIEDADEMILAYNDRQGGAAWNAPGGGGASIEILGDFNNDGNFDLSDLRYWADGLAIDETTGNLDRFAGFQALQDAAGAPANLFAINTPYSTGASYKSGDAAADIAGSMTKSPTRGWTPNAHDGNIDAADIDYVVEQFVADANAEIDWADTAEAAFADLSADVNGDLLINKDDVEFIVEDILESELGDVNLDGVVDATDASIASSNFGAVGWANGDVNCDGIVDQLDVDFINSVIGVGPCSPADVTTDGTANGVPDNAVTLSDFSFYLSLWSASDLAADLTTDGTSNGIPDGAVTLSDFSFYLSLWSAGCP